MISVDMSNVWGQLSLPDLLELEKDVAAAHEALAEGMGEGKESLGWLDLPVREPTEEVRRIWKAAERIREASEVCVVLGTGGSCLGARAAIELLQGPNRNVGKGRGDPQIFFAGNSLSTRSWNELMGLLEGKDFSVVVISRSGTTMESAIAFRGLRWMLERKYGTDKANRRIYAITDPKEGALRQMAEEAGWECFDIPSSVGAGYAVLSAAGLLPMAVADIDILGLLYGAMDARECYDFRSLENPAWQYAAVRNLMQRSGKAVELFVSWETGFRSFGRWWQQLFAGSEGKNGRGLFPAAAEFTEDLHLLGQLIQGGERNLFETMVRFDPPQQKHVIGSEWKDLDGLNYLEGKTLDFVEETACQGTIGAHVDGGVPVITMDCGALNERTVGELFYFLELSCAISAYVLGTDPFEQSGRAPCWENMFAFLGKPDGENG